MSWRLITYVLLQGLKQRIPFLSKIRHYHAPFHKQYFSTACQLFFGHHVVQLVAGDKLAFSRELDDEVRQAIRKGGSAVIAVMDKISDLVGRTSKDYRTCLGNQIQTIKKAIAEGPESKAWDDLPKYNTQAENLLNELNSYISQFNAIGEALVRSAIARGESGAKDMELLAKKFTELEKKLLLEFEQNKQKEIDLLRTIRTSK